jgi:hypothetical protein
LKPAIQVGTFPQIVRDVEQVGRYSWGVRELLAAGVDMTEVERTIEAYCLDRDHKDALWLWAMGRRERPLREATMSPDHRPGRHTLTAAVETTCSEGSRT